MNKFEITMGDARFHVSIVSRSQNHRNTPINKPHFHIDKELHVVLAGSATIKLNGKEMKTAPGDIFIIAQNVSHYYEDVSEDFNKIGFLFSLERKHGSKKGFSEYAYYSRVLGPIDECITLHDEFLVQLASKLLSLEYSDKSEHIYQALYALFFITVAGLIEQQEPPREETSTKSMRSYKDSCEQKKIIETFIFKRYHESITIEDLAHQLYKSVPQTHRIVKNYFNDNFRTVLTKQRMEQACILVREGKKTLCEIAYSCGYSSYNGFLSAFKKYTGKTPAEYRSTPPSE